MTVYVDRPAFHFKGRRSWCHLTADTLAELHKFAARLKLRREWFQDHRIPHYDISEQKREIALGMGAQSVVGVPESVKEQVREGVFKTE